MVSALSQEEQEGRLIPKDKVLMVDLEEVEASVIVLLVAVAIQVAEETVMNMEAVVAARSILELIKRISLVLMKEMDQSP